MPNRSAVDLEIGLHRHDATGFTVELRYDRSESGGEIEILTVPHVRIDVTGLRQLALDPGTYGRLLTDGLFGDDAIKQAFAVVCGRADEQDADVRLRLLVAPTAVDLHRLRWETLRDPRSADGGWLVTSEKVLFSRYLSSRGYFGGEGWREVEPRSRGELQPVVMIANPTNLADYKPGDVTLAPIAVADELQRAKDALADLPVTEFASGGQATLDNLVDAVRDGCNLVYLVCHGALAEKSDVAGRAREPHLWLEQPDGSAAVTPGAELVERFSKLPHVPRLVVLASCQSGGGGEAAAPVAGDDGEFLRALGPRLAEVGVPAVVAMQGDVAVQTVATFIPSFFTELRSDGLVDRAMAVARGAIQDESERWKPMLFMRLRTGRLWTPPDLSTPDGYRAWPSLVMQVNNGTCVPILGPGTYEALTGSRREIARRWAQENQFPLGPDDWNDLPRVAQYVAVTQKSDFMLGAFQEVLASEVKQRFAKVLPPELRQASAAQLLDLLRAVGDWQRANDPDDTYRLLAELPIPLYVTTNPSKRLHEALVAAGKEPAYATCPWTEGIVWPHSTHDGADPTKDVRNPLYQPDPQHPLVYHVFGHLENLESLVLTEDSIFDYLIGVTRYTVKENKGSDPAAADGDDPNPSELPHIRTLVNSRLARSSLLFLGFPVDDWSFRVLLRTIIDQPGSEARKKKPQLAVQLDPEDDRIENPAAARGYLAEYLREAGDIDVFWTGVEDFVKQLHDAVRPAPASTGAPS